MLPVVGENWELEFLITKNHKNHDRSHRGCLLVCEALGWGPPREGRGLLETLKAVAEIVATAVDWLLLFVLRKTTEAELTAEAKVNLSADSCSSESKACERE